MLSRFVENAALESAAQELIQQAHMMVNEKHFNALHLKIKIQNVVQCLIRNQNRCFIYLVAFLSSYHEKATERCTSLLWSCRPYVYHTKIKESRYVPFQKLHKRTSHLAPHCPAGKLQIQIFKSLVQLDSESNPESTEQEPDALSHLAI